MSYDQKRDRIQAIESLQSCSDSVKRAVDDFQRLGVPDNNSAEYRELFQAQAQLLSVMGTVIERLKESV